MDKKAELGQIYTEKAEIDKMLSLIANKDKNIKILEPSAGDGRIYDALKNIGYENVTAIEIDSEICRSNFLNIDFFDHHSDEKYDLIIGNPPYVKYNRFLESTKNKLEKGFFNNLANLYLYFIKKSIDLLKDDGELIFLNPSEFIKLTSAKKLNEYIYANGVITDFIDYGDKKVFKDATPNVCIWRYKKGIGNKLCMHNGIEKEFGINKGGVIFFGGSQGSIELSELFDIKVGGFSAADKIFTSENGNKDFVCSETRASGKLRRMYYNIKATELEEHKNTLMARGCREFNENNWWEWGRFYPENDLKRIYVNCRTRVDKPFFLSECKNFDGSVLALFLKDQSMDEKNLCDVLNSLDWEDLGFKCGGRYMFGQRTLSGCKISY